MAEENILSYKCPACGSPLTYDPSGKLTCAASTNEWFLWEFDGILSGIRPPKSTDKWA